MSYPMTPTTLWNDPGGLVAAPPPGRLGPWLSCSCYVLINEQVPGTQHRLSRCLLIEWVGEQNLMTPSGSDSLKFLEFIWIPLESIYTSRWTTTGKWGGVCWTPLSSWEERNRREELLDELLWALFSHTPTCLGEKLSPICSVFSASISSGSRECKSASEAKLKRTTLWPVLSGLQISQA